MFELSELKWVLSWSLYVFYIIFFSVPIFRSFMARTKIIDPSMTPRCLKMLTCTMNKHLHIHELIPIV